MSAKEDYYAALEKQSVGENTVKQRFEREKGDSEYINAVDSLYADIGMKTFHAFHNCLDWLGRIGGSSEGSGSKRPSDKRHAQHNDAAEGDLSQDLEFIKEGIKRIDDALTSIEAGLRRIDKFTLEAFRNIQSLEERMDSASQVPVMHSAESGYQGRLSKEEATRLAIDAAQAMRERGSRLTLAAVAREAGLKYGQIVYAFGNKEGFMEALEENAPPADFQERLGTGA